MHNARNIISLVLAAFLAGACSFLHDDKVVAEVEGHKLYKSQVVKYIPHSLPEADSLSLAQQYIRAWAAELIMTSMADTQLSPLEKDVSRELEQYRNSLLKYRYEQHYIADRLDTTVTHEQIEEYFYSHQDAFALDVPIVKARYIRISVNSPMREKLMKLLSSRSDDQLAILDTLSYTVADRYVNYGDQWVDMITLSRDFGMDYGSIIASMDDGIVDIRDEQGMEHIAVIDEFIRGGNVPPLDYCEDKVKDMIIGQRKYTLSSNLERELLDDAVNSGKFVIYDID